MRSQSVRHEVELSVRRDEGDGPVILEPSQSHTPVNTQEQRTGHTVTTTEYAAVWHTIVEQGASPGVRRIEDSSIRRDETQIVRPYSGWSPSWKYSSCKRFPSHGETGVSHKTAYCLHV